MIAEAATYSTYLRDVVLDCLRHRVHSPLFVNTVGHSCPSQATIASSTQGGGNDTDLMLTAGKRAAAIMTLIRSAQLNGHDPLAYLKDG